MVAVRHNSVKQDQLFLVFLWRTTVRPGVETAGDRDLEGREMLSVRFICVCTVELEWEGIIGQCYLVGEKGKT